MIVKGLFDDQSTEALLLDAITNEPIVGFENLNSRQVDLGTIDWQEHPLLRIFINSLKSFKVVFCILKLLTILI